MRRRPSQPVNEEHVSAWRRRLQAVRALLGRDPRGDVSWYLQVRERVLVFLLNRYSDRPAPMEPPEHAVAEAPRPRPRERAEVRSLPADHTPPPAPPHAEADPGAAERIRSHMQSIAGVNREIVREPPSIDLPKPLRPPTRPPARKPGTLQQDIGLVLMIWLLLQLPIVVTSFALGRPLLGLLIADGIILLAIAVAAESISRAVRGAAPHVATPAPVRDVRRAPGKCHRCSYDLRHATGARCPECGTPIRSF